MLTLRDRDQAGSPARLSKVPDPWTQRARPPVLGKPVENAGYPQLRPDRSLSSSHSYFNESPPKFAEFSPTDSAEEPNNWTFGSWTTRSFSTRGLSVEGALIPN